jgi:hypothetical protein
MSEKDGSRPEQPVVRKDGEISHVHVTWVDDEEALLAEEASAIALTIPAETVLPDFPRCHLMEGGMGI